MIIDAHTHIGFGGIIDMHASAEELLVSMKKAKIDKALVFAGELNDCSTERLLDAVASYPKQLYTIGSVSPLSPKKPTLKQVENWLAKKQIYGLKFYPGYEHFYPADASVRPYLDLLSKYNRPAIFHSGDTYNKSGSAKLKYAQAIHIDDLATELPELKIVIAHFGYPWEVDAAEVCYKNKNVYVDCSGFVYDKFTAKQEKHFREVIKKFELISNDRNCILFGTDWPIGNQSSYLRTMQSIMGKNFAKFYSENAIKLFGLE
jgi:hypothetical protein